MNSACLGFHKYAGLSESECYENYQLIFANFLLMLNQDFLIFSGLVNNL